jgi:DNA modification methylase
VLTFGRDLVNHLYYGDNLEVLSNFISDESVDLVYLDPPFNKNAEYSVIFRDESGRTSDAQMATLEDYWHWGPTPASHYRYLTNSAEHGGQVSTALGDLIGALHSAIRPSPLLAYLVEMAVRLVELRRKLKPTGSIYLHCDPTASHYLKLVLDAIFGPTQFRNEIIWRRTRAHNDRRLRRYGASHDVILFYTKGKTWTFNRSTTRRDANAPRTHDLYRHTDGKLYRKGDCLAPGGRGPLYEWNGHLQNWRFTPEVARDLEAQGLIVYTKTGMPRVLRPVDLTRGSPLQDLWIDVERQNSGSHEALPYPTQKPVALLARIIQSSSNPGDLILDPFCGCGTAIEAAVAADRKWIGIDISNLAVEVIQGRLAEGGTEVPVFDWPTEMDGVRRMAQGKDGGRRFETWALARLGLAENKRGGDGGIDGRIGFTTPSGRPQTIIVSVKGYRIGPKEIRELKGTISEERAVMGLMFTLEQPTQKARDEAYAAGFYSAPDGHKYPRVLVHTASELIEQGRLPDLPTKLGTQSRLWPIPASRRSVRLRPARDRKQVAGPATTTVQPVQTPGVAVAEVRANYAASQEDQRSPRTSTRDQPAPQPSLESVDTD